MVGRHKLGKPKPISINQHVDWIEMMLFDRDEPGCRDTDNGDMVLTNWGRTKLWKRLKQIRDEGKWRKQTRGRL